MRFFPKVEGALPSNTEVASMTAVSPGPYLWTNPLIQRCAAGEQAAWDDLYAAYSPTARRFLRRMGVGTDTLDDICQDVFLQVFRYLPDFRGECGFQTWLYKICASEARRHRQKARVTQLLSSLLRTTNAGARSMQEISTDRAGALVDQALRLLSEKERLVFVLYELEGLPGQQIAEIAQCPEATVWRRLHYARAAFRKHVEERGAGP